MELAVMNFIPAFCPSCGAKIHCVDFAEGASIQCDCGLMAQYASREAILTAAKEHPGGDLERYA